MEQGIHVVLAPEQLGSLWGIPITNTLITSWIVIALLVVLAFTIGTRLKMTPSRLQTLFEWLVEFIYDYVAEILESKALARTFFPLLVTLFLFIFTANLLEFTPGIGSIGFFSAGGGSASGGHEFTPLLRSVNTDLNVTLALAAIAFVVIEVTGIVVMGLGTYLHKFFPNPFKNPIGSVVGFIEVFSELARLISFSFRLFGNILAGEVLILVATYFIPYAGPVPLMAFEVFVGFIQAAIFALLTLFFIKIAITPAH
ncbi:ATP synthase F0 subunit A [Candidatus Kaiserbacteria bacterium RIFCSPHIGHO2_01_FULL_53_29]|uniref:ATP synthase subunit a n=1 Tax=Candidatus Kaiserbacteria bacterium RIFCSPHIGHO2_01_FULL_53_29 TaxID=1798480 RepID=A0A1F6CXN9_9BACT|nr:MAG: ATP synthase F0 subunit A [Candidatus Kaiserbacteria bacterium RIFCSPHIGHO2_01_FULL_53_29]